MRRIIFVSCFMLFFNLTVASASPADVSVCFTPRQDCGRDLLAFIYSAKQSIRMQSYSFTLYKVAHALVAMKQKGIDVQVIMDKSQFQCGQFSQAAYLIENGIPVFNDDSLNIAHSKIVIVDDRRVETGSFNYTSSAEHYNGENLVFIDSKDLATDYLNNWQWRQGQSTRVMTPACINSASGNKMRT